MNKAFIIGNLTRDPELKTTPQGNAVCTFTVAVSRRYKREETDFIPVVAWRKTAEHCVQYLGKGLKVAVSGEIQTRSYEAKDGTKRYVTEIIADEVEFLSRRGDAAEPDMQEPLPDFGNMPDDDLPF